MSVAINLIDRPPPINFIDEGPLHPRHPNITLCKSKLTGVIHLMSLIGGFCISSVAELKGYENVDPWIIVLFLVVTVCLTSMALFVIFSTSCILPYLTANEELDSVLLITGLIRKFKFHKVYFLERQFEILVQITWLMASTGTVLLFVLDMILITWIKFSSISRASSYAGASVMSPTLLLMVYFGVRFWKELLHRKLFGRSVEEVEERMDSVTYHSNPKHF